MNAGLGWKLLHQVFSMPVPERQLFGPSLRQSALPEKLDHLENVLGTQAQLRLRFETCCGFARNNLYDLVN